MEGRGVNGQRWNIRTQFVGDDGWTHEAKVEGPPTPGYKFVEVVPAEQLQEAVRLLDAFDRYSSVGGDGTGTAYLGSPFAAEVSAFLKAHGKGAEK